MLGGVRGVGGGVSRKRKKATSKGKVTSKKIKKLQLSLLHT